MSVHSCPNCGAAMAGDRGPLEVQYADLASVNVNLRTRIEAEGKRAEKAEAVLRASCFCEAHEPIPDMPETSCPMCEAVHENDLRLKAEADRDEVCRQADLEAKRLRVSLGEAVGRTVKAEADAKRLREIHAIIARLASLLQYEATGRVFLVSEVDLFRDTTIGPKLCAGKTLFAVLNEALAAKEASDGEASET